MDWEKVVLAPGEVAILRAPEGYRHEQATFDQMPEALRGRVIIVAHDIEVAECVSVR